VDVGAKREIHSIVKRLAASGMAIVLVSSELEEVRAVATRIVVMSRGAITAEFDAAQATDDALALTASADERDVRAPRRPGGLPHQTGGTA
jgi:erythritol transport system ATP-binding protein